MKLLAAAERLLVRLEKALLVFFLSLLVSLSFLQVILRLFFSGGFLWADIFLRHLVLWLGFLGAGVAAQEGKHFAVDLLQKRLPGLLRRAAALLVDVFAVGGLLLLTQAAFKFYRDEVQFPSVLFHVGAFELHSFWLTAILPAGFVILLVHFGILLIGDAAGEERPQGELL